MSRELAEKLLKPNAQLRLNEGATRPDDLVAARNREEALILKDARRGMIAKDTGGCLSRGQL